MKRIVFICLILQLMVLAGCGSNQKMETYSRDIFAMDTYINCQIVTDDLELAAAGLDAVEKIFMDIDRITNRFADDSEVSMVNDKAGIEAVKVSEDLFAIVKTALTWSEKTDGAFNILVGSVMDLWGFGTENPGIPSDEKLAAALARTDYHKIDLDKQQLTVFLPEAGMVMDLGGVVKGYATDKVITALAELGIKNALINAGGNVYCLGKKADGTAWKIGVQDPLTPQGIKAVLNASDCALVSSGNYQRFFELNGVRYHHIIDPADGYPSRASVGTTIIMRSATLADILSTAIFIKGPEEGIKLADELSQVDAAMIITGDGEVYGTKSLNQYLEKH